MAKNPKKLNKKQQDETLSKIQDAAKNGRIEMAPQGKIGKIPVDYLTDFFLKILEMSYWDCFISDESSLHDFSEDAKVYTDKIKKIYGVDVDPKQGKLYIFDIVNQIKKHYK